MKFGIVPKNSSDFDQPPANIYFQIIYLGS